MGKESLRITSGVEEFFIKRVRSACLNQKLEIDTHTEFYLVRLLSDFCRPEHRNALYAENKTAFAIHYLESLQQHPKEKIPNLKQLGDLILYLTGFFQESFRRHHLNLEYYYTLGGSAYHKLHILSEQDRMLETFQETFLELAQQFPNFVEILCEISESSGLQTDSDLLRLYERWLTTGSQRLLNKLQAAGIHPTATPPSQITH